jgi:hypothetical protein
VGYGDCNAALDAGQVRKPANLNWLLRTLGIVIMVAAPAIASATDALRRRARGSSRGEARRRDENPVREGEP